MSSKVLILIDGLGSGGAERQMFLTAAGLSSGWRVVVWTLHDGVFRKKLEGRGIEVVTPDRAGFFAAVRSLRGTCRSFRPDIVHAWGSASLILGRFLLGGRVPIVNGTVRRSFKPRGIASRLRLRVTSRLGKVTVSNSHAAIEALGLSRVNHRVIHNGYSPERSQVNVPVVMDPGKTNAVMCANIKPGKNFMLLVDAALKLHSRYGDALPYKFWLIGASVDQGYRRALEHKAESLVAGGHLEFTGGVDSPAGYLASADIGVLLSDDRFHSEGLSNSIMEYMAAGLPVVCSRSGGNGELVTDGVTGFLVDSEPAVISALEKLRTDAALAGRMGLEGRDRIQKEFSLEAMLKKTEDLYREIMLS